MVSFVSVQGDARRMHAAVVIDMQTQLLDVHRCLAALSSGEPAACARGVPAVVNSHLSGSRPVIQRIIFHHRLMKDPLG
jgi:hypothetical protein